MKLSYRIAYLCLQTTREGQASHAHVREIIRGLTRRGWHVTLFEPEQRHAAGIVNKLLSFVRVQSRLWKQVTRFELIYVRSHVLALPSVLWAKVKGVPVVQEINGPLNDLLIAYPWTRPFSWLLKRLSRWSQKMSDALIVVTPALKTSIAPHVGSKPVYVIPNGANTELFHPGAGASVPAMGERFIADRADTEVCPHDEPGPYALFFGALAQWQGIDTLLKAQEDPLWPSDVRLVIAGEGAMRPQIEKAANLRRRVIYLGKMPYHEMPGVIARSLVTISPQTNLLNRSSTGLFPLKVFESLSCGVPVVVTDFPGQADLIRAHQCGLVIPAEDPTAIARAVAYFREHPEDRNCMGERGRDAVLRHHSWDLAAEHTAQVLTAVLKGSQPCLLADGDGAAG